MLSSAKPHDQRLVLSRLRSTTMSVMRKAIVGMSQVLRNANPPTISPKPMSQSGRSSQTTRSSGSSERRSVRATPTARSTNGIDITCGWRSPRRKLKNGISWIPAPASRMRVARHQNQNWSGNQLVLLYAPSSRMPIQFQNPAEPKSCAANSSRRPSRLPMTANSRAPARPKIIGRQSSLELNPRAGVPGPPSEARRSLGAVRL